MAIIATLILNLAILLSGGNANDTSSVKKDKESQTPTMSTMGGTGNWTEIEK